MECRYELRTWVAAVVRWTSDMYALKDLNATQIIRIKMVAHSLGCEFG